MRALNVLFVANWWYPSPDSPMIGLFVHRHAKAAARSCRVAVVHLTDDLPPRAAPQVDSGHFQGLFTVRARFAATRATSIGRLVGQLRYARALIAAVNVVVRHEGAPDVVHVNLIPPPVFEMASRARLAAVPMVITEHSSAYLEVNLGKRRRSRSRDVLVRRLLERAYCVTVPSHALGRGLEAAGLLSRYQVLANVVDCELFRPRPEARPAGVFRLIHVSGLKPVKNVDAILRVVAVLRAENPAVELAIVGDGPERQRLEAVTCELGLRDRGVVFRGHLGPAAVAEAMGASHALIHFSHFENAPCVIAEALASGLPVVASAVGGVPELIAASDGFLVAPGDEAGLAQAVRDLVGAPDRFATDEIRRRAAARFDAAIIGRELTEIYRAARASASSSNCHGGASTSRRS